MTWTFEDKTVLVIGRGEIGSAVYSVVSKHFKADSYDIADGEPSRLRFKHYDVLHICIPYQVTPSLAKWALDYANLFTPKLILIESTVAPDTTREISKSLDKSILLCHSPVNGRLLEGVEWGLTHYTKFIGPMSDAAALVATKYYEHMGLQTRVCENPEQTEWMKILDTTYWGLLIGWWQEIERISHEFNLNLQDICKFFGTIQDKSKGKIPRPILYVGPMGGHCIISNARLLLTKHDSNFVEDIIRSQLTFESSMQSTFGFGEKQGCPLCGRIYTRKIYRDESSEPFIIIECLSCRTPMVVFRSHRKPSNLVMMQSERVAKTLFPSLEINLSKGVIPDHPHYHLRKKKEVE